MLLRPEREADGAATPVVARQDKRDAPAERRVGNREEPQMDAKAPSQAPAEELAKAAGEAWSAAPAAADKADDALARSGRFEPEAGAAANAAATESVLRDATPLADVRQRAKQAAAAAPAPVAVPMSPAPRSAKAEAPSLQVAAIWHAPEGKEKDRAATADEAVAMGAPGEGAGAGPASDGSERVLRITLRNPSDRPLILPAGSIRLVGLNRSGSVLWRTALRSQRETAVPAGGVQTWDEPVPVIPPGAARLRVEAEGARSDTLEP